MIFVLVDDSNIQHPKIHLNATPADHQKIKKPTPRLGYVPDTAVHIEKKADTPRGDLVKKPQRSGK
jgi:hypothetical protein